MTDDKLKDDRSRTIGVRLTDEELADLPPAGSDAARVRNALLAWRALRDGLETVPQTRDEVRDLRAEMLARMDALQAEIAARLGSLSEGPDAFSRLAVEADARDVEASVSDVLSVCMEIWHQAVNNHLSITLIREALVDGDGDPEALRDARIARLMTMQTDALRTYTHRADWLASVTREWRQMRLEERGDAAIEDEMEAPAAASAAAE